MPRSRELPQRPSPRGFRTSMSESDPIHRRSRTAERSPRPSDGRVSELESQLSQTQEELKHLKDQQQLHKRSVCMPFDEMAGKLEEKEREVEILREENEKMKREIHEKLQEMEEMSLRLKKADEELERSECSAAEMREKLENEMKMVRVQAEQWRKAADVAAAVLAGEMDGDSGEGKRRGTGIKMFGELWRKKATSRKKHHHV